MREPETSDFLASIGWAAAERHHLAGDASARSYERVRLGTKKAVLVDAPPGCGDDMGDFMRVGVHLLAQGLSAPLTYAIDEALGLAIIEDFGDALFARLVEADPQRELPLYLAASDALVALQQAPAMPGMADLTADDWADSALFAPEFYARAASGATPDATRFRKALADALKAQADGPRVVILRDFHAENLIWLPEREGVAQVGLLDFQLAQLGQPEYDLVSLLQDARRDVSEATEAACLAHFAAARGLSVDEITPAYATLGALRALRILGIFARLNMLSGKDRYLAFLPRVWGQLMRNLAHPALADLRAEVLAILPAPSEDVIERIRACRLPSP